MEVGVKVRVTGLTGAAHYRGNIRAVNVDGTFDITYEDGVHERSVSANRIHRIEGTDEGDEGDEDDQTRDGCTGIACFSCQDTDDASARRGEGAKKVGDPVRANHRRRKKGANDNNSIKDSDVKERSEPSDKTRGIRTEEGGAMQVIGDWAMTKWLDGGQYCWSFIRTVNPDGTFDVMYDDGTEQRSVPMHRIHRTREGGGGAAIRKGEVVWTKWRYGKTYCGGIIRAMNADGTFDISYSHRVQQRSVPLNRIRLTTRALSRPAEEKEVRVGDRVLVIWLPGVIYYRGAIHAINANGTFDIDYKRGRMERSVALDRILRAGSGGAASSSRKRRGRRAIKVGDRVGVKWLGDDNYYWGSIRTVNTDGTFDVDYHDGDKEQSVPLARILLARVSEATTKEGGDEGCNDRGGNGVVNEADKSDVGCDGCTEERSAPSNKTSSIGDACDQACCWNWTLMFPRPYRGGK